jgi:hypothetical protein
LGYSSEELLEREKNRAEWLVPITLDFDVAGGYDQGGIKIKDRFLWNLNGTSIPCKLESI